MNDAEPQRRLDPTWEVSPQQVKIWLDAQSEDFVLLDCRFDAERDIARIEPSEHIPMDELEARVEELADFEGRQVVVYCHHGMRSLRVAAYLRAQGVGDAKSMAGGIEAWSRTIDPSVPEYE